MPRSPNRTRPALAEPSTHIPSRRGEDAPRGSASRQQIAARVLAMLVILLVAGCAGGGCTSGCACGGLTPLPNGFTPKSRVENGGSVRLTADGLAFLQQNIGTLAKTVLGKNAPNGVLTFQIPKSSGSVAAGALSYTVCPQGPSAGTCSAEIDVGNAKLAFAPQAPHNLRVTGPIPIRLQNLPIDFKYLGFISDHTQVVLDGNGACPSGSQTFAGIGVDVNLDIAVDQNMAHSRFGYTRLKVKLDIDQNQLKNGLHFCTGVTGAALNLLKDVVFSQLIGPLLGTLQSQIDQQLCMKPDPNASTPASACPSGTQNVGGICRYGADAASECASIMLGADGHIELGGLLAGFSPSTRGGLDFLFAAGGSSPRDDKSGYAWGDLDPVNGGATLGMYGGAESSPLSSCVKLSQMAMPTGIPIPVELLNNGISDWPSGKPGPHVGVAVSERFVNYAMNGVYNSGAICVAISTEAVPQLSSGTLGLLAASSKALTIQQEPQQVALVVRPSSPPKITFGNGTDIATDPLLRVKLDQAAFDFYVFSLDRFIRFMTVTFDLDVPVNLAVTPDGILPVIDKIGATNGKVTNSELLRESPTALAAALADLFGSLVGQAVGGGLKPINLNGSLAALGVKLDIPESVNGKGSPGLRKLSRGTDNYLGIFADLALASQPLAPEARTSVSLASKSVDRDGVRLISMRADNAPSLRLHVGSSLDDGAHTPEFSYRIDQGVWHPFTRSRWIDVSDPVLRLQARHLVQVRSRAAGDPMTLDPTPAELEVLIDVEPPLVSVGKVLGGKVALHVRDAVSEDRALARYKLDGGAFSAWAPAADLSRVEVGEAAEITIEAKDEEGNVATAVEELRGRIDGPAGCGCAVVGGEGSSGHGLALFGIAVASVLARVARRRAAARAPSTPRARGVAAARRALAGAATVAVASSWAGCNCGVDQTTTPTSSSSDSGSSSGGSACPGCTSLDPGLVGSYTSVAVAGDKLWVAGYSEGSPDDGYSYGDLVVGLWDGTKVAWQSVDGVPSDPPVDPKSYDVTGFRGGQTESGDDVGTWTSIAVDAKGNPAVAYFDRTHHALKFAQLDGAAWQISTIEGKDHADIGRYAKLIAQGSGFVIAYQWLGPGGDNGALASKVRVATTTRATPKPADWTFEDAAVNPKTPCRASYCGEGTKCVASTKICTATLPKSQCNPACSSSQACVDNAGKPACASTLSGGKLDAYPEAIGDYIALAANPKGGMGIAFYDRIHGNLGVAWKAGDTWKTQVVDGANDKGKDTGDMGVGASLFIDASGTYHFTYIDGLTESLRYVAWKDGALVSAPEIIDDGTGVAGKPFDDGHHLVGDDASLVVTSGGEVRVAYQDATVGKLRYAVGAPSVNGHTWTVKVIEQKGFAGAFSHIVQVGNDLKLVNWWRTVDPKSVGDVAVVSP
jgi:hypothetical protein